MFADCGYSSEALLVFLLGGRADDHRIVGEERLLNHRRGFGEFGFDGSAEEAVNVRDEENTAASLIHACANRLLVAVEQGGFIHLNETDEVAWSFAFAHQQGKAVGKGAFAHAVRSDQDDVTV